MVTNLPLTHRFALSIIDCRCHLAITYPKSDLHCDYILSRKIDLTMGKFIEVAKEYGGTSFSIVNNLAFQCVCFHNQEQGDKFLEYLEPRLIMLKLIGMVC